MAFGLKLMTLHYTNEDRVLVDGGYLQFLIFDKKKFLI